MAISKITYKASPSATPETWMDATGATAAASDITAPKTAMLADGVVTTGTGSGGIIPVAPKDVNFRDYDGTIVYAYTAAEFANLTAFPDNPSHLGLIAQGWNWSLSNAQTYVAKYGKLEVGQTYITDDGKTRLYCHFEDARKSPYLGIGVNGVVTVDWGDGTSTDTITGSDISTVAYAHHDYSSGGDYVIALKVESGNFTFIGGNQNPAILRKAPNDSDPYNNNAVYYCSLKKVEIGQGVTSIGGYGFSCCYGLSTITIPNSVVSIDSNAFYSLYIKSVVIPKGTTTIGTFAFGYGYILQSLVLSDSVTSIVNGAFFRCYALQDITIPPDVTVIDGGVFNACVSLSSIIIPDGITSLGSGAFSSCTGLKEIHFHPQTPPTLANTYVFTNVPEDCIFYVPTGSLTAYTTATNYPSTYTYVEE